MKKRLPTDVMGTLAEILKFWVSRMILFSLYLKNEVPFKEVYLWSMVTDARGIKMSKSKGNVVNPVSYIEKYGADALRMAVVYGVAPGGKVALAEEKVRGMRNFANKVWNVARFVQSGTASAKSFGESKDDEWILEELKKTTKKVNEGLEKYRFGDAAEAIYEFVWHKFADIYIEKTKSRKEEASPTLHYVLEISLKLLHPFMPFVTEAIYQESGISNQKSEKLLMTSEWPLLR
jgi:valyl-tRNA synthetase